MAYANNLTSFGTNGGFAAGLCSMPVSMIQPHPTAYDRRRDEALFQWRALRKVRIHLGLSRFRVAGSNDIR